MESSSKPSSRLEDVIKTDMTIPLDPDTVKSTLSAWPFVPLPNAINFRDLGLLPSSPLPPGLLFRSGAIHQIPPESLANLGVKMILDLRSEREVNRDPNPSVPGVQNIYFPGSKPPTPIDMAEYIEDGGTKGYANMYLEILEIYAPSFRRALEWLRDEQSPMLFHCTAGKDRTGVLAALLLRLAGASKEVVALDYALTRVGVETRRGLLLQMLLLWNKSWNAETPGFNEFTQVKGEFILGFLQKVEEKFGSVEGYVKSELVFSENDARLIKHVLVGDGKKTKD